MKILSITLLAGAAALTLSAAPIAGAQPADGDSTVVVTTGHHGDWTLRQREDWLHERLEKARDDGALDRHEFDRVADELHGIHADEDQMRDQHDGQLTDNETTTLEARLDGVAAKIHWLREESFQRPW
jgi:hypothetical protein